MQSSESLGVLTLIFPSAPVVQGWTTACDWLEAPLLGHNPCHRFIDSCPQGVLRTIRVVIQPESSGCLLPKRPLTYAERGRKIVFLMPIKIEFYEMNIFSQIRMILLKYENETTCGGATYLFGSAWRPCSLHSELWLFPA